MYNSVCRKREKERLPIYDHLSCLTSGAYSPQFTIEKQEFYRIHAEQTDYMRERVERGKGVGKITW